MQLREGTLTAWNRGERRIDVIGRVDKRTRTAEAWGLRSNLWHVIRDFALFFVITQCECELETLGNVVRNLTEAREYRAVEVIVVQQVGRVRAAGADQRFSHEAQIVVRALRDDDTTLDIGRVNTRDPA